VVTTDTHPIKLTIKSGTGKAKAKLAHCTATTKKGVATFKGCRINKKAKNYKLKATDSHDKLSAVSRKFKIT
jgi:hypothetical protein